MFVEKTLTFGYNDDNMIPNTEGIWEKCYNQSPRHFHIRTGASAVALQKISGRTGSNTVYS